MPRPSKRKQTSPRDPVPKRGVGRPKQNTNPSANASNNDTSTSTSTATVVEPLRLEASSQASMASTATSVMSAVEHHEKNMVYGATFSGKMRDLVIMHVLKRNGEDLKTNITHSLAFNKIFKNSGITRANMNSISLCWRGHPALEIRLKKAIDIDELDANPVFTVLEPEFGKFVDVRYECEIEGVRGPGYIPPTRRNRDDDEDPNEPWIRWVSIEGAGYCQKPEILETFLTKYGDKLSQIEEETIDMTDEDPNPDEEPVFKMGNGIFKMKMSITEHIPQFLPIGGRKVKIYYRGIPKVCTRCYEAGHTKTDCENIATPWLEYVSSMIESMDKEEHVLFGKWTKIVKNWKKANQTNAH